MTYKKGEKVSVRLPNGYSIVGVISIGNATAMTMDQVEITTDYPYQGTLMWVPVEAINGRLEK